MICYCFMSNSNLFNINIIKNHFFLIQHLRFNFPLSKKQAKIFPNLFTASKRLIDLKKMISNKYSQEDLFLALLTYFSEMFELQLKLKANR